MLRTNFYCTCKDCDCKERYITVTPPPLPTREWEWFKLSLIRQSVKWDSWLVETSRRYSGWEDVRQIDVPAGSSKEAVCDAFFEEMKVE